MCPTLHRTHTSLSMSHLPTRNAVVPEYVKSKELLTCAVARWVEDIRRERFDANDQPIRHPRTNRILISSLNKLQEVAENAVLRLHNCVPPTKEIEANAWYGTGQYHNTMEIMKPRYHSCNNESWHSTHLNFVTGLHAHAQHYVALLHFAT